ncbi:hypothetical protein ADK76_17385 [Streptomyces griseoflavus]|uniref:hypothetical protein n=1 Tax=Streptomyces rimosus TaxID=1927 RepID=UPI0004C59D9C|nr:hypothetical protein [Streptomyces rimosus]KOG57843.1 hypothetical protein ADK76_17385 [Streptomyces griseoflavus]
MNLDLVRDWAVAAIAVRVFSADIRMLLRRLAAAQVLAGVSELTRTGTGTRTGAGARERLRTGTRTRTRAAAPAHQARDYGTPYGGSPYNAPYGSPSYGPQRDHDLQEGER